MIASLLPARLWCFMILCFLCFAFILFANFCSVSMPRYELRVLPLITEIKRLPIAIKISLTLRAVLADVSMKRSPFSSAYSCASWRQNVVGVNWREGESGGCLDVRPLPPHTWCSTALLSAMSALLPARAITMLGLACLCNSFTQFLARTNVSWGGYSAHLFAWFVSGSKKIQ